MDLNSVTRGNYSLPQRILGSIAIPGLALVIMTILCLGRGVSFIGTINLQGLCYTVAMLFFISMAVASNMNTGRIDFSIGGTFILCIHIGGMIAKRADIRSSLVLLILMIAIGMICTTLVGIVYVITNIPPLLVAVGFCLFYEGFSYTITGARGVDLGLNTELMSFNKVPGMLILLLIGIALAILVLTTPTMEKSIPH